MKTLLNLLPEENKKEIEKRTRLHFFLWQFFLVFVLEILYISILVSSYIILDFQLKSLTTSKAVQNLNNTKQVTLDTYQKRFKEMNTTADVIKKISDNHFSFSQIFPLLDTLIPEGVVIDQVSTKNYTISLIGKAEKRDQFLSLDKNLKEASCLKNIDAPLSSLFSQENIEFTINFEIKKECLKQKL